MTVQFRLRLSRDCCRSFYCGSGFDWAFRAGSWISVEPDSAIWPGKPFPEGSAERIWAVANELEPVCDSWSFQSSSPACILGADDIAQLEAPDSPEWRDVFAGAPFPVKFVSEQPS